MSGLKVLGFFVKWMVVPAAIAFAGYVYIGPKIGTPPPKLNDSTETTPVDPVKTEVQDPVVKTYPEPAVTLKVTTRWGRFQDPNSDSGSSSRRTADGPDSNSEGDAAAGNGPDNTTPDGEPVTPAGENNPDSNPGNTGDPLPDGPGLD